VFGNRSIRLIAGIVVLIVAAGVIAVAQSLPKPAAPQTVSTVTCIGGSEKNSLLDDAEIAKILLDRYSVKVNFSARGSLDLVQIPTAELKQKGVNCLWPSNASAQLVFEKQHNVSADFPGYRGENVLNSPLVVYSWAEPTTALISQKIVEQRGGNYYIVKMKDMISYIQDSTRSWQTIGAPNLRGPIRLKSTNPTASNSGNILYLLMLNILATGNDYDVATMANITAPITGTNVTALQALRDIYTKQGLQPSSSGFGFEAYLTQGVGAFPLYAGYESQILEASVLNATSIQGATDLRILYPEPTVWSSHPILALDANAQKLIAAMKDPEVQQLAWRKHGFRSAVYGISNKGSDFPLVHVPDQIVRVVDLPGPDVILKMNDCLANGNCS
jgi:hypothetical protein